MREIRIAIAGVGNCASSLIQGIAHYKKAKLKTGGTVPGLAYYNLAGYEPRHIRVVAAFDIDKRKVGKPVSKAIFAKPNCTKVICRNVPSNGVKVEMGPVLDGYSAHMEDYPEDRRFLVSRAPACDIRKILKDSAAEILINYLPVGSQKATEHYAECCLSRGVSLINCIPVFIASDETWARRFKARKIPIIGDDVKSQIGATIIHRALAKLFSDRGIRFKRTYQLNTGGNTDFLNMLDRKRLRFKKISKTNAVKSQLITQVSSENIHIGPSDYVPWQKDNKVGFIRMEGEGFGGFPIDIELRLSVEDSPNSAGVVIDAIRCCKLARDRRVGGVLYNASSYFMKHPPIQISDNEAMERLRDFISGKRRR
ncbi:MAG: inositol-3-phosphate synthase [Candidatus Omnitrophota bacterium]